jgi:hypothetical protein
MYFCAISHTIEKRCSFTQKKLTFVFVIFVENVQLNE